MASPSETYAYMVESSRAKILAPWHVQIIQGILAGCYVALGGLLAVTFEAGFSEHGHAVSMIIGGAVFPMGLIGVVFTGANLFTGNCMYTVPALLNGDLPGQNPRSRAMLYLTLSWFTNFIGCLLVDFMISYAGGWIQDEPVVSFMKSVAVKKTSYSWGKAFVRGMGANWLVCLAMWQAMASKDGISKIFSVWWPVFAFTALGFEHSIANMFYIVTGMQVGAEVSLFDFLIQNEVPVTLGNWFAGAVFLGAAQWMTHDPKAKYSPFDVTTTLGDCKPKNTAETGAGDRFLA